MDYLRAKVNELNNAGDDADSGKNLSHCSANCDCSYRRVEVSGLQYEVFYERKQRSQSSELDPEVKIDARWKILHIKTVMMPGKAEEIRRLSSCICSAFMQRNYVRPKAASYPMSKNIQGKL